MAARIFGERIDDQIGPVAKRALPERAQKGVVDRDGRLFRVLGKDRIARPFRLGFLLTIGGLSA